MTPKTVTSVPAKIAAGHEAAVVCGITLRTIFVFKSSQNDIDTVTKEHLDPIITAISEQIGDPKVLQAVIDKHVETRQSFKKVVLSYNT